MIQTRVRVGGLMRCCLATLDDAMRAREEPVKEGETMQCKFGCENGGMIFHDNAWEWNRPKDSSS